MEERIEPPEDLLHWRTMVEIGLPVGSAFGAFCDAARIQEWVPDVVVKSVRVRTPSGLVSHADLEAWVAGARVPFAVRCTYDANRLFVRWQTLPEDADGTGGTVAFLPLGPRRSLMIFDMHEPRVSDIWSMSFEARVARTRAILESFRRWAEVRA